MPVRMKHLMLSISPMARVTREIDKVVTKRKNRIELTAAEKLFANSLSTVYKADLSKLRKIAIGKINNRIEELTKGARRAKLEGRDKEFKLILKTIKEVKKEMETIR